MPKKESKPQYFIDLLDDEEIMRLYKHFSGVTQVKFKDRQDAEVRLLTTSYGKGHGIIFEALKKCKVHEDTVKQWGGAMRGPIAFPHGQMSEKDLKKHSKALAASKPAGASSNGNLNSTASAILLAIREMKPTTDDASVSSTEVAEKLNTNLNTVMKAADQLAKRQLITIEEDSADDKQKLSWFTILPAGRDYKVEAPAERLPAPAPGPSPRFAGRFIFRLVKENPRRPGTHGYNSFNHIFDGIPYEEYRRLGGRNNDLQWDIDHKFVELRDVADAPKPQPEKSKPKVEAPKPEPAKTKDKGTVLKASSKGKPEQKKGAAKKK